MIKSNIEYSITILIFEVYNNEYDNRCIGMHRHFPETIQKYFKVIKK